MQPRWKPIGTPTPGKLVIVCNSAEPDRIYSAVYRVSNRGKRWCIYNGKQQLWMRPTHFIEIPEFEPGTAPVSN